MEQDCYGLSLEWIPGSEVCGQSFALAEEESYILTDYHAEKFSCALANVP